MLPAERSPGRRKSWRPVFPGASGCLAYLGVWLAVLWAPGVIRQDLGWPYAGMYCLLMLLLFALIQVWRIHRRGQTVPQAWAAGLQERRLRTQLRERARQDAAVLPWLTDERLSPAAAGVLITPAPDAPAYFQRGYDVVLDSAGDKKIQVIKQVRKLTRLSLKDAKDFVDSAPVTLLRAPDQPMADAAKSVLEAVGAAVSVIDVAS